MSVVEVEVDQNGNVLRAIVSPNPGWAQRLGGTWVLPRGRYSNVGANYTPAVPEQFVEDKWSAEQGTQVDPVTGEWFYTRQGQLTWHNGRVWRNVLPDGTPNVWEPGVANWQDYPMGDEHPMWVQPTGAFDAYPIDFVVEHNGGVWRSTNPANVWEPGVVADVWVEV